MTDATRPSFEDYQSLVELYAEYGRAADAGDWDRWLDLFVEDCVYRVQPRENFERNRPLATFDYDSKAMLRDRVFGIRKTLFHGPHYQHHTIGLPIFRVKGPDRVEGEAAYSVVRTRHPAASEVFNVGRSIDAMVRTPQGWRFSRRHFIYDSEIIPSSLIYLL